MIEGEYHYEPREMNFHYAAPIKRWWGGSTPGYISREYDLGAPKTKRFCRAQAARMKCIAVFWSEGLREQ